METPLASQLGGDLVLKVRTEPGDHPQRPSTGSSRVESLPRVGHCFGVHTKSLHMVSGFWKEVHSPDHDIVKAVA